MADTGTLECITEHERILQEIESTDTACVGPTLRWENNVSHKKCKCPNLYVYGHIYYADRPFVRELIELT